MNKLHIGTAGIPHDITKVKSYADALDVIKNNGLEAMEVEFVRGVNMNLDYAAALGHKAKTLGIVLTAHAPYYINLNAMEKKKVEASKWRILKTAEVLNEMGGYSVVFHPGYYLGAFPDVVYKRIEHELKDLMKKVSNKGLDVWIRPELMGKRTQFGSLEEVVKLSENIEGVLPTIDFAHAHARNNGKCNTKDEWREMLNYIEEHLGRDALDNMHIHLSDIEYTEKGEKRHVPLGENTLNWRDLIDVLKEYKVKGALICESPIMGTDAIKISKRWNGESV